MEPQDLVSRRIAAAEEFQPARAPRRRRQVVESLGSGLTVLRDALLARVHDDVPAAARHGLDALRRCRRRRRSGRRGWRSSFTRSCHRRSTVQQRRYVASAGRVVPAMAGPAAAGPGPTPTAGWRSGWPLYRAKTPDQRRLAFSNVLATVVPESRRAPLVLFRLLRPAVQIVTALAFGRHLDADGWRKQQIGVPAGDPRLPGVPRRAAGKRRAVPRVRQPAVEVRLAGRR